MSSPVSGVSNNSSSGTETGVKAGGEVVGKDDFLQLLVAQIKNQNPLNPADGVEFVSQLVQFSQLEQLINIRAGFDTLLASDQTGTDADSTDEETSGAAAA